MFFIFFCWTLMILIYLPPNLQLNITNETLTNMARYRNISFIKKIQSL